MAARAAALGKGGSRSWSRREVARHFLADQIGAGRQGLAEFDEGRPHRLQRQRQALPRAQAAQFGAAAAPEMEPPRQQARAPDPLQGKRRVVPRQDGGNAEKPGEVAAGTPGAVHGAA